MKSAEKVRFNGRVVKNVYRGQADKCCCGCSGTHSEKPWYMKKIVDRMGLLREHESLEMGVDHAVVKTEDDKWLIAYFAAETVSLLALNAAIIGVPVAKLEAEVARIAYFADEPVADSLSLPLYVSGAGAGGGVVRNEKQSKQASKQANQKKEQA